MDNFDLVLPKMGESITEATILSWVKQVGEKIEEDETVLEVATDKVDSELPSPITGVISEILYQENEVVKVGQVIARITPDGNAGTASTPRPNNAPSETEAPEAPAPEEAINGNGHTVSEVPPREANGRTLSPLVRNILQQEGITTAELDHIKGTGPDGRITKNDVLGFLEQRDKPVEIIRPSKEQVAALPEQNNAPEASGNTEIIEMDRMRSMIADHMVMSKRTSPHVSSFVEVDMTRIVQWRERIKNSFQAKHGQKITFTPIFVEAIVKAIKEFPQINASVSGKQIVVKKDINIGIATALPSGNLIVPVVKDAKGKNLLGLTHQVNQLVNKARNNKLSPEDISGGTFTLSNVGTFRNLMGTPIINQPEVAILATGMIKKRPVVIETEQGDIIAIRHMMYLSLSYDHRIVDGFLGGSFLARVGDFLEAFDDHQDI